MRIGDYVLEGELGRGGMGCVYTGRHVTTGALRAVKVLEHGGDPEAIVRFRREAETLARAGSGVAVAVHESGQEQGRFWFAMDLMSGGSLEKRTKGGIPWREAAALVADLARKVSKLHALGLVHRDLKPANVLFAADGTPRLADFGCVRDLSRSVLTQTGALLGTPAYMSPEQLGGERVGPPSDVFALGAILHELVSGARPYAGSSFLQILSLQRSGQRARLEPAALEALVAAALAPDPARRPGALELAVQLDELLADAPSRSRRGLLLAIPAACALALAALAWRSSTTTPDRGNTATVSSGSTAPVASARAAPPTLTPDEQAWANGLEAAFRRLTERAGAVDHEHRANWPQDTERLLRAAATFPQDARGRPGLVAKLAERPTDAELEALAKIWDLRERGRPDEPEPVAPNVLCRVPFTGWRRGALLALFSEHAGREEDTIPLRELPRSLFLGERAPARWSFSYHHVRITRLFQYSPNLIPTGWDGREEVLASTGAAIEAFALIEPRLPERELGSTVDLALKTFLKLVWGSGLHMNDSDRKIADELLGAADTHADDPYQLGLRRGEVAFAAGDFKRALVAFRQVPRDDKPSNVAYVSAHVALAAVEAHDPDAGSLADTAYKQSQVQYTSGEHHQALLAAMLARAIVYAREGDMVTAIALVDAIKLGGDRITATLGYDATRARARVEAEKGQSERK